jgi:hypothetical protein
MAVAVVRQRYPHVMTTIESANGTDESAASLSVTATSATGARAGRAHAPTTADAAATTGACNKSVGRQTVRALLTVIEQVWTSLSHLQLYVTPITGTFECRRCTCGHGIGECVA